MWWQHGRVWRSRTRKQIRLSNSLAWMDGPYWWNEAHKCRSEDVLSLLEAIGSRDPGHLEKVRTRRGKLVTAGDEEEPTVAMEEAVEGKGGKAGRKYSWLGLRWVQ